MKDYYEVLGVTRSASQEEIKRAYRQLARQHHPDVSVEGDDMGARFKEINEAYEILSDPERRRRYDLFGEEGPAASLFDRGFEGFSSPFGDIFNLFFGRGQTRTSRAPQRGRDLLYTLEITLQEAFEGTVRSIEIPRNDVCSACGGTGLEKGYEHDLCPDCGGEGMSTRTRRSNLGSFTSTVSCQRCGGSGEINTHPCPDCEGRGSRRIIDELEVSIPAGVDDGDRMRITGRGEAGHRGGAQGDLYVEVRVSEHDTFSRHGSDLHALVSVDISEAALGTDIEIPTLNGEERLHIPAGSQPGDVFKLRGKGMPEVHARSKGDLFLTLEVKVPRKLNAEQKRLLKEYQRIESQKKDAPGMIERLRKAMRTS
ncbi:MAG: molecular chaperone DnaJ [Actinobacteria bacterium]|nr:molecular chaperone DnaJ [Actinomycetota bacterium]